MDRTWYMSHEGDYESFATVTSSSTVQRRAEGTRPAHRTREDVRARAESEMYMKVHRPGSVPAARASVHACYACMRLAARSRGARAIEAVHDDMIGKDRDAPNAPALLVRRRR